MGDRSTREVQLTGQLRALGQVGAGYLGDLADPRATAARLAGDARRLTSALAVTVWVRLDDRLVPLAAVAESSPGAARAALPLDADVAPVWATHRGEVLRVDEPAAASEAAGADGWVAAAVGRPPRALAFVPLQGPDPQRPLGTLELVDHAPGAAEPGPFGDDALDVARALAAQGSLALHAALGALRRDAERLDELCALAAIPEHHDPDAPWHVRRIAGYAAAIARGHGLSPDEVRRIELASTLHDVGKVAIPTDILLKPGKLTDEEFAVTREHCRVGRRVLAARPGPVLALGAAIAHAHHERWDGTGYPEGLAGEAVPLAARIVAVADVFDALTTRRSYKPAIGLEQSLRIIRQEAGRHFDPALVDVLQAVFSEVLDVKRRWTPEDA